jgi:hypothetical protein
MTRRRAKSADQTPVWDAGDDGNSGSNAQPACGFRGTPPSAIVYAASEFIWGISLAEKPVVAQR